MRFYGAWSASVGLALLTGCGASDRRADVATTGDRPAQSADMETSSTSESQLAAEDAAADANAASDAPSGGDAPATSLAQPSEAQANAQRVAEIEKLMQLAREGDFAQAHELAVARLADEPKNRQYVRIVCELKEMLARQKLQAGDKPACHALLREGAACARRLIKELGPLEEMDRSLVSRLIYHEASADAQDKKFAQALATVKELVELNSPFLDIIEADPSFAELREEQAFQEWRAAAGMQIAEQLKQKVRKELAENKPFPFDFTLADPDGKSHKLADFQGKIALVDFWGTWCPPCQMEIPHLIAIQKKYAEQGVAVVGLNYREERPSDITDFVKQHEIPYPCLIGDNATKNLVPDFRGFPTMLFLDRTGKVRFKHSGYAPRANLEAVIEALLAEGQG